MNYINTAIDAIMALRITPSRSPITKLFPKRLPGGLTMSTHFVEQGHYVKRGASDDYCSLILCKPQQYILDMLDIYRIRSVHDDDQSPHDGQGHI